MPHGWRQAVNGNFSHDTLIQVTIVYEGRANATAHLSFTRAHVKGLCKTISKAALKPIKKITTKSLLGLQTLYLTGWRRTV